MAGVLKCRPYGDARPVCTGRNQQSSIDYPNVSHPAEQLACDCIDRNRVRTCQNKLGIPVLVCRMHALEASRAGASARSSAMMAESTWLTDSTLATKFINYELSNGYELGQKNPAVGLDCQKILIKLVPTPSKIRTRCWGDTCFAFLEIDMIQVKELRRSFGPVVAVDGISFTAQKGQVLGLLGPNGAGKTTAMRMLACFIKPDSGTASVCGYDILRNPVEVRRSIGYLAESSPAYSEMTVGGFLDFVCDVRQIKGNQRKRALDRVVPMCSIESVYHQTIETLSKGYKRRVGLAQALISDPAVLILDEPTDGLDPNQKYDVRQLISRMAKDKCIIISTHILEEVEAVCTRSIIIARGRILVDSTPEALKQEYKCSLDEVFRRITRPRAKTA